MHKKDKKGNNWQMGKKITLLIVLGLGKSHVIE